MSDEVIKIAVLEQKLVEFSNIVGKIDNAIEKISEVNTNIIKMLAVHDERIEQCNRSDDLLIKSSISLLSISINKLETSLDILKSKFFALSLQ